MKTKKPKTTHQKLIQANDNLFRQLVRARDKVCQKTGKTENLQVCHFWTRKNLRVRWDLENACLLNSGIHRFWAHSHFQDFQAFWLTRLGKARYDRLELKARYAAPIKEEFLLCVHYELKKEVKKLEGGKKG